MAVASHSARALTPEEDFAARCNPAAGVIVCEGFDLATAFIPQVGDTPGLHAPSGALSTAVMGFQDTSVKASGASSLRFDILPNTPADVAGNFIAAFGQSFGQNSTFYVQFQQMMDTPMATFDWGTTGNGTAPKAAIFYGLVGGTCQSVEITTVSYAYAQPGNRPTMYTNCGSYGMETDLADTTWVCPTCLPKLIQQPASSTDGYSCQYASYAGGTGNGTGCFIRPANKWVTFYYKIHVGTWGSANSTVDAWVAVDGGPYKQWIRVPNMTLTNDYPTQDNNYSRVMLTPYMTGKGAGGPSIAHTWYDELIVSTQPIAAPGGKLSPPTNLRVMP
jgi:hypothetical protein